MHDFHPSQCLPSAFILSGAIGAVDRLGQLSRAQIRKQFKHFKSGKDATLRRAASA